METSQEHLTLVTNRVTASGLVTIDLESVRPKYHFLEYDLKQNLYLEQILREKDFRSYLSEQDWSVYRGAWVAITCSVEAIIPLWAYMLLAGYLEPFAARVILGSLSELQSQAWRIEIEKINTEEYINQKVVVKGCGDAPIPESAYVDLTMKLKPLVKSLMFGEPCSTVPLFKNKGSGEILKSE